MYFDGLKHSQGAQSPFFQCAQGARASRAAIVRTNAGTRRVAVKLKDPPIRFPGRNIAVKALLDGPTSLWFTAFLFAALRRPRNPCRIDALAFSAVVVRKRSFTLSYRGRNGAFMETLLPGPYN